MIRHRAARHHPRVIGVLIEPIARSVHHDSRGCRRWVCQHCAYCDGCSDPRGNSPSFVAFIPVADYYAAVATSGGNALFTSYNRSVPAYCGETVFAFYNRSIPTYGRIPFVACDNRPTAVNGRAARMH